MRSPSISSVPSFDRNNGRYRDARILHPLRPTSMTELDYHTEMLMNQLHDAWSTNASPVCYLSFRDQILSRREQVDTCVATLKAVVTVTCPEIAAKERYSDPR